MCRLISILFILSLSINMANACPLKNIIKKNSVNPRAALFGAQKCIIKTDVNLKLQKETMLTIYDNIERATLNYCMENIDQTECLDTRKEALALLNILTLKAQQLHWDSLEEKAKDTTAKTITLDTDIAEADALIREASDLSKTIDAALEGVE